MKLMAILLPTTTLLNVGVPFTSVTVSPATTPFSVGVLLMVAVFVPS